MGLDTRGAHIKVIGKTLRSIQVRLRTTYCEKDTFTINSQDCQGEYSREKNEDRNNLNAAFSTIDRLLR